MAGWMDGWLEGYISLLRYTACIPTIGYNIYYYTVDVIPFQPWDAVLLPYPIQTYTQKAGAAEGKLGTNTPIKLKLYKYV